MKTTFLDFEQPIAELESKIEELRFVQDDSVLDISEEISRLQKKSQELTKAVYAKLTPWQISQVARHPQRPYTLDYIKSIFTDFHELHGDRAYADDPAIVSSRTSYGVSIDASVQKGNIFATQFHPEKSGSAGLDMLRNFAAITRGEER